MGGKVASGDLAHADAHRFTAEVGQEASGSRFGRSKSHANAEADHIKMFNPHLPVFCLSPTSSIFIHSTASLLGSIGPVPGNEGRQRGGGKRGERGNDESVIMITQSVGSPTSGPALGLEQLERLSHFRISTSPVL